MKNLILTMLLSISFISVSQSESTSFKLQKAKPATISISSQPINQTNDYCEYMCEIELRECLSNGEEVDYICEYYGDECLDDCQY